MAAKKKSALRNAVSQTFGAAKDYGTHVAHDFGEKVREGITKEVFRGPSAAMRTKVVAKLDATRDRETAETLWKLQERYLREKRYRRENDLFEYLGLCLETCREDKGLGEEALDKMFSDFAQMSEDERTRRFEAVKDSAFRENLRTLLAGLGKSAEVVGGLSRPLGKGLQALNERLRRKLKQTSPAKTGEDNEQE